MQFRKMHVNPFCNESLLRVRGACYSVEVHRAPFEGRAFGKRTGGEMGRGSSSTRSSS